MHLTYMAYDDRSNRNLWEKIKSNLIFLVGGSLNFGMNALQPIYMPN